MQKLQVLELLPALDQLTQGWPETDPRRELLHVHIGFPPLGVAEIELEEIQHFMDHPEEDTAGAQWLILDYVAAWQERGIHTPFIRLISGDITEGSACVRALAVLKDKFPVWIGTWPTYQALLGAMNMQRMISESGTGADQSTRSDFWVANPGEAFVTIQREPGQTDGADMTLYEPGEPIDGIWPARARFWRRELARAERASNANTAPAALASMVSRRMVRLVPMDKWRLLYDASSDTP